MTAPRCLVLAFESAADLPSDWARYAYLALYGPKASSIETLEVSAAASHTALDLRREPLEITGARPDGETFGACFIRHPDPWGEPRSWLCAIAALGECLSGTLTCVVHRDHEGLAFNFLLVAMLGSDNVKLEATHRVDDPIGERHLLLSWAINPRGVQSDMATRFRKHLRPIIRKFYVEVGQFHRNMIYFPDAH